MWCVRGACVCVCGVCVICVCGVCMGEFVVCVFCVVCVCVCVCVAVVYVCVWSVSDVSVCGV